MVVPQVPFPASTHPPAPGPSGRCPTPRIHPTPRTHPDVLGGDSGQMAGCAPPLVGWARAFPPASAAQCGNEVVNGTLLDAYTFQVDSPSSVRASNAPLRPDGQSLALILGAASATHSTRPHARAQMCIPCARSDRGENVADEARPAGRPPCGGMLQTEQMLASNGVNIYDAA